jgi:perosamine synthetase
MADPTQDPFGKYNGREAEYVLKMLAREDDGDSRSWPQRLEEKFCDVTGAKHSVACNSGTSGLHMALYAAGVGPGDEVISPALTVVMDAYATIHLGATPIFVDVDPDTFNIDAEEVAAKVTRRTKAILTVSLEGLSADMDPIMRTADKYGLIVVEDSAQTLLGTYHGKIAGTIGHLGVYSFENKKHMTCGSEGGMVVSNDPDLATRARKFGGIGYKHMTAAAGRTNLAMSTVQDPAYERFDTIGLNYRMNELSAAVGLAQLERIDDMVGRRRKVAALFTEAVEGCGWVVPQVTPLGYVHSYYTFAAKYFGGEQRDVPWKEFYHRYVEAGGDGFYGACIIPYLEPALMGRTFGSTTCEKGLCPVAEDLQSRIMQFKTNYRDITVAERKAAVLSDLIDEIGR